MLVRFAAILSLILISPTMATVYQGESYAFPKFFYASIKKNSSYISPSVSFSIHITAYSCAGDESLNNLSNQINMLRRVDEEKIYKEMRKWTEEKLDAPDGLSMFSRNMRAILNSDFEKNPVSRLQISVKIADRYLGKRDWEAWSGACLTKQERKRQAEERQAEEKRKADALIAAQKRAAEADKLIAVGSGSSFAVNAEGIFISNQHVIDGCSKIELMKSGKPLEASVLASDERNDLALIQLSDPIDQEVFFRLSDEPIKVMDGVFVGGFPFGNLLGKNVKVTSGIVSSMAGINDDVSQLMIDAAIQPGNSGGPIFLTNGKLAAVTVASLDSLTILKAADALPQNTNFGIKLSVLREFLSANNVTIPEQSFFTRDFERDDLVNEAILQVICYARKGDVQKLKQRKVLFDALMKE